ncbi:MAG: CRTAC1 family protein [Acidobacteria bacterium]|nr:CRTAC1 family protein [Acidobacteriota bacterium]
MFEIMGSGLSLLDFDGDGDLDVYFVQAGNPMHPAQGGLLRNESLEFVDVTQESGLLSIGLGQASIAADFDGNGWCDLYLSNLGVNELWLNQNGRFVQERSLVGFDDWTVGVTVLDFDRDGWLDLYVCGYVAIDLEHSKVCLNENSRRDYCGPRSFEPVKDLLLKNQGAGVFEDATQRLGNQIALPALSAASADFDNDGWPDIYVANDNAPNVLWMNKGDGSFINEAMIRGCALNWSGTAEASMGVAVADFDHNGWLDILVAHMDGETNTLYSNTGNGQFIDASASSGLGGPSLRHTAWSPIVADFDGNGWLDIYVTNGGMEIYNGWQGRDRPSDLREPNQLFLNRGHGVFELDLTFYGQHDKAGWDNSRGAAVGDLDNDGDLDVIYSNNNGPSVLLVNELMVHGDWIGLDLRTASDNVAYGAVVHFLGRDGMVMRYVHASSGYASSGDSRIQMYLSPMSSISGIEVIWPSGVVGHVEDLPRNRYVTWKEGWPPRLDL